MPHPLLSSAQAELAGYRPADPAQQQLRADFIAHLDAHADGLWRDGPVEHLTASCLVLDRTGTRVLLTHHRRGGFWAQFGGHCEPEDATLPQAALREASEESGLARLGLRSGVIDLDRHELPPAFGPCRAHLDVRYVAVAPTVARPRVSEESLDVAWHDVDALPSSAVADLSRLVAAARARLAPPPR